MSNYELRLISSLGKVFPHSAPPARPEKEWLSVLNGETVSLQIAYLQKKGGRAWGRLKIDAPGLEIKVRRVRYMPGCISADYETDDGYLANAKGGVFPDLLEPMDMNRLPLIPGLWQNCWIDIQTTGPASGSLPISISIENTEGEVICSAKTSVKAIPVDLPPSDVVHTRWFHADCLAQYYGVEVFSERHWEIIENFAAYAAQHGINTLLTPIHTPPIDTEIGGERLTNQLIDVSVEGESYSFGFEKLKRWVDMCRRVGIEYFEMAHLFTQWGAKHAPKIMGTKNGEYIRLFGWETDSAGPDYENYLQQMLPALTEKLREWGIADKTFFHISDEPGPKHFESYSKASNIVKPLIEGFKTADAMTNYEIFQMGAVKVPIPAVDHIEPFLEGNVKELWTYACCVQSYLVPNHFMMLPSFRSRILGVLMYKYNITGYLHWGYNFYSCMHSVYPVDPYVSTDSDGTFPSGDSFMVYPGKDGKPLGTLRLMVVKEAFNDISALKLLEKSIGRDAVLEIIEGDLEEPLTFKNFPQSEEYLLSLRHRINSMISQI